ncbi:hypothetical protein QUB13_10965 [Microcoleus sp. B4-D4]
MQLPGSGRNRALNALHFRAGDGWDKWLAGALHKYLYSLQRDFAQGDDRSPYRRSVNKPIGLDS